MTQQQFEPIFYAIYNASIRYGSPFWMAGHKVYTGNKQAVSDKLAEMLCDTPYKEPDLSIVPVRYRIVRGENEATDYTDYSVFPDINGEHYTPIRNELIDGICTIIYKYITVDEFNQWADAADAEFAKRGFNVKAARPL